MIAFIRLACVALLAATLSACAYKPLKAPCAPDEGNTALGYASEPSIKIPPELHGFDSCGPMKPI